MTPDLLFEYIVNGGLAIGVVAVILFFIATNLGLFDKDK